MSGKRTSRILGLITIVAIIVCICIFIFSFTNSNIGPCTTYECDVKFDFYTTINIQKQGEDFAKIKGEKVVFKEYHDPLTMYSMDGEKIGYAGDSYHLISQDSHSIILNGEVSAEMVGLVRLFGEAYDIYDASGNKIAHADFNPFNTEGELKDTEGNIIADYSSIFFFRDYTVRIKDNCPLDENTVMLIFASYYSDQHADNGD